MSVNERAQAVETDLSTAWGRSRIGAFLSQPVSWVFIVVGGIIAFLSLYPTFFLFYGSLTDAPLGVPGQFTVQNYVRAYTDPEAYPLLLNSFIFGFGASGLSIVFALTLAWITIRTNAPYRRLFELTAIVPNILPPILVSISWVMLLNPSNGLINAGLVQLLGVERGPFNIYSMPGLIFVEGLILTPLAFLIIAAAMKSMDPSLEESAKTLGSNEFGIMRRITFPLIRPAILAAATLNFVRAVESFDTPAIIALPARIEVFTTKIWREALGSFPTNHNLAAAYGVGILGIALVFVYLYRRFTSQVESFSTVTGKGFRPHQIDLGRWRYAASGVALLLLIMLVALPILVLILVAILPYYHVPTWQTWQNLTLDNFRYVWETPRVHKAFM
ncbi:MAG TPA: ABC transporter permease subunit, partial [Candidatus Binatia bacterium]